MTDTDRMVVWLREAMDTAQHDAEMATPGPWTPRPSDQVTVVKDRPELTSVGIPVGPAIIHAYGGRSATDARHIARHDPAAVLRRIAADRKILEWCTEVIGKTDLSNYEEFGSLRDHPEALAVTLSVETICNLAEGWGWIEGQHG